MPAVSIGDMSQHFLSIQNGGRVKADLARLGQELSSGKHSDIAANLGGDTRQLSGLVHSLSVLNSYQTSAKETGVLLDNMQLSLQRVDDVRAQLSDSLLKLDEHSQPTQIARAGRMAETAFVDIVNTLNRKLNGVSIFGGSEVELNPLADPDVMLDALRVEISGLTSVADISQTIDNWFMNSSGGFMTSGYLGSQGGSPNRPLGNDQSVSIDVRSDDLGVRAILKSAALAAVLPSAGGGFTKEDQGALVQAAGIQLLSAAEYGADLQARVGFLQERVEIGQARLSAEAASLEILQNDITRPDPFETATKLQAVQTQLETHFTVTSRLSRLSMLEFI